MSNRLSYPGSLSGNGIGDGGAGAVAAAAGTMPCLETLGWVLVRFPFFHHSLSLPSSHQSFSLLDGHVIERDSQIQRHELFKSSRNCRAVATFWIELPFVKKTLVSSLQSTSFPPLFSLVSQSLKGLSVLPP